MEFSGFFDAHLVDGKYDRAYLAEHFAKYFASFISNGVFGGKSSELIVRQKETADMSVRVLSGQAFIGGYFYENDDELSLSIDVADGVLNRIDLVVLRWDNIERVIRLAVKKGVPSTNPAAPVLQRDADFYELQLARVYVEAGATQIAQDKITDTRLDKNLCGFVMGVVDQFDTTSLGIQIDAFIRKFEADNVSKMNEVLAKLNTMADENDVAGLILDIENLVNIDKEIKSEAAILKQTLGYSKKNLLPFPFTSGSIENNGITYTVNNDGTVTANGTASANSYFTLYRGQPFGVGKFLVNSNVDLQAKHYTYIRFVDKQTSLEISGTTKVGYEDSPIEVSEENMSAYDLFVGFAIIKGTTVSNLVIKPMVRRAEILDGFWEPYNLSIYDTIREDKDNPGCFYRPGIGTSNKEWINPPAIPGVEYRTAERHNGKPVYQFVIYDPILPITPGVTSIDTNMNLLDIISVSGVVRNKTLGHTYPTPFYYDGDSVPAFIINKMTVDGWVSFTTTKSMSNHEAYIMIKYTKP